MVAQWQHRAQPPGKTLFKNTSCQCSIAVILKELDRVMPQGIESVYFIPKIFLPNRLLREALLNGRIKFGVQMHIALWTKPLLELLNRLICDRLRRQQWADRAYTAALEFPIPRIAIAFKPAGFTALT